MHGKKQILKGVFLLCSIFSIMGSLFGCYAFNPIVGKWQNSKSHNQYCFPILEFFSDGTVKATSEITGTYKIKGNNKIEFDMELGGLGGLTSGQEYDYEIQDNSLSFSGGLLYCEYSRVSTKLSREQKDLLKSVAGQGKIVFDSMEYVNAVYIMNPDGSDLQELNIDGYAVDCSPDGKQIIGKDMINREYFIVNIDGSNRNVLTSSETFDTKDKEWSPDKTAYVIEVSNPSGIALFNADSSISVRLAEDKQALNPIWCP